MVVVKVYLPGTVASKPRRAVLGRRENVPVAHIDLEIFLGLARRKTFHRLMKLLPTIMSTDEPENPCPI